MRVLSLALAAIALTGQACVASERDVSAHPEAVIYGNDDRRDVYAVEDSSLRELALSTSLALVAAESLRDDHDASVSFDATTFGEAFRLCDGQRFESQPSLAACSGTLVDDDLVLTAAHCADIIACESQVWVFDYAIETEGVAPTLAAENLHRCRTTASSRYTVEADGRRYDHAFVQLDRPVSAARPPASLALEAPSTGERLCVIGYPSGLPLKVDCGAELLDERETERDYLTLSSDSSVGSSGSGVYDARGMLLGSLSRGGEDFEYRREAKCRETRELPHAPGAAAEEASYIEPAIASLCESGWPSPRLCGTPSRCGDGTCSVGEHESCRADCPALAPLLSERGVRAGCHVAPQPARTTPTHVWAPLALGWLRRWRRRRRGTAMRITRSSLASGHPLGLARPHWTGRCRRPRQAIDKRKRQASTIDASARV